MSELDNILNSTFDNTLTPYINKQYTIFMNKLPAGIALGAQIPPGITVPPNSNWTTVPTKQQFTSYIINQINSQIWNSTYTLEVPIPLYFIRYLFNYSYILSFLGAIFYSVGSFASVDFTSIIVNKNVSFFLNIIIGLSSFCATIIWFFHKTISDKLSTMIQSNLPL